MKIQEILDLLSLTELPAAGQPNKSKCAALVQRRTGQQDYVITKNGGIATDIGYKSAVVKIVEFYPVVKAPAPEPAPEPEKPVEVEVEKEKPTLVKKPVSNFARIKAITFLEKKNFSKEKLSKKTDKQLQELMDGFR